MPDLFRAALTLSLTSLGITFLALAMFALLILALRQSFSAPRQDRTGTSPQSAPESDEELAAMIGLAVHLAGRSGRAAAELGAALLDGPGPYWAPLRRAGFDRQPPAENRDD